MNAAASRHHSPIATLNAKTSEVALRIFDVFLAGARVSESERHHFIGARSDFSNSANFAVEVTRRCGSPNAGDTLVRSSSSHVIQVVFAQVFKIVISMICVGSVDATLATTIRISFSTTGSGVSTTATPDSASQMGKVFPAGVRRPSLSYTISSEHTVAWSRRQQRPWMWKGRCTLDRPALRSPWLWFFGQR